MYQEEEKRPRDCFECKFFGKNGEHIKSGKAHFPSLCEKNLLFFKCKGKQGERKFLEEHDIKVK